MNEKISKKEKEFLFENYNKFSNKKLSELMDKKYSANYIRDFGSKNFLKKEFGATKGVNGYFDFCKTQLLDYNYKDFVCKEKETKIANELLYKSKYGKYHVNQDYFKKIDNEFKAYWLGFLYADGCVRIARRGTKEINTMEVSLCRIDEHHLEKMLDSFQSDSVISQKDVKLNGKIYEASRMMICNKEFAHDLNNLGCTPNKSLTLKFPAYDKVPKKFVRDFIRGYFDGDGSIHINHDTRTVRVGFTGTESFLCSIANHLSRELDILTPKIYKKQKQESYQLNYGSHLDCHKIFDYLYNGCNIYLDRKLEKFNTLYCLGCVNNR